MYEDVPIVQPPSTMAVDDKQPKPVLYLPDGRALVRDQRIGFSTRKTTEK